MPYRSEASTQQSFELSVELGQLLIRGAQVGPQADAQIAYILNGALEHVSAVAGVVGLLKKEEDALAEIVRLRDFGYWQPKELGALQDYFEDVEQYPDPHFWKLRRMPLNREPFCHRREDLVPDAEWYDSEFYKKFRIQAQQDATILATIPAVTEEGIPLADDSVYSLCFCREIGAPAFTEAERDFSLYLLMVLGPLLHRLWFSSPSADPMLILDLPLRLRRVVSCLMNGDTEKRAAQRLGLSHHTVHSYVRELYELVGVRTRAVLMVKLLKAPPESGDAGMPINRAE
jgi:DNA-binding CsgD family transcriptional regulator